MSKRLVIDLTREDGDVRFLYEGCPVEKKKEGCPVENYEAWLKSFLEELVTAQDVEKKKKEDQPSLKREREEKEEEYSSEKKAKEEKEEEWYISLTESEEEAKSFPPVLVSLEEDDFSFTESEEEEEEAKPQDISPEELLFGKKNTIDDLLQFLEEDEEDPYYADWGLDLVNYDYEILTHHDPHLDNLSSCPFSENKTIKT